MVCLGEILHVYGGVVQYQQGAIRGPECLWLEEEAVDGLVAYSWDFHQDGKCLGPI